MARPSPASTSSVEIVRVPADLIDKAWPDVAPILDRACRLTNGRQTLQGTFDDLAEQRSQLWVALRDGRPIAACVTWVSGYHNGLWLQIGPLAGHAMSGWFHDGLAGLRAFAREQGCVGIILDGRPGWARVLRTTPVSARMEIQL